MFSRNISYVFSGIVIGIIFMMMINFIKFEIWKDIKPIQEVVQETKYRDITKYHEKVCLDGILYWGNRTDILRTPVWKFINHTPLSLTIERCE